jgi:hypothetical protein
MISKDLLLAGNYDKISVINVNSHNIIRRINASGSKTIFILYTR